jgi:hypothetical protein
MNVAMPMSRRHFQAAPKEKNYLYHNDHEKTVGHCKFTDSRS